ncbi:MAG: hypothetical protein C5B57_14055 [Blastocatellia bacterium]|nr:MAG: hypothetical protein C5B57_14055 [Blastocatellia bacterium]
MHYSRLLHNTSLGVALGGGVPWLGPAFETLHFVGMALLLGYVGMLDLRILGVGKDLPIGPIQRLMPWALVGFTINLITGIGFYAGNPDQYQSLAFVAKLLFIMLAVGNALLFYLTGISRRLDSVCAGQDAPVAAKLLAVGSLFSWIGVIFWGRLLPIS